MPNWVFGLILFVAVWILYSWGARRMAVVGGTPPSSATNSPPGRDTTGSLEDYFTKITEFDGSIYDHFFVTAMHLESQNFVQVSVGSHKSGKREWQFDMPLNDAQSMHENAVAAEAKRRDLAVDMSASTKQMRFLDILFHDRDAHDAFARWVVTQVFGASEEDVFEISWG